MIVEYIGMQARCKDCAHLVRTMWGNKIIHQCARDSKDSLQGYPGHNYLVGPQRTTLQNKACGAFKLFGSK